MSQIQIPGGPNLDSTEIGRQFAKIPADRRAFLRRAATLGLAVPGMHMLANSAAAQESDEHGHEEPAEATPGAGDGYVGSSAQDAGTGDASPVPSAEVVPFKRYDPYLAAVEPGTKDIEIVSYDVVQYIANRVPYAGWTFDGTIPGRALRVVEGDTVNFTFRIDPSASAAHSVDFHSAKVSPDRGYKTIEPGEEFSWSFVAKVPGAFMYHCGTAPVLMHIGAGMYGTMIVDPKEGLPPAQDIVLIQSDFYLADGENGVKVPDYRKMLGHGTMDYVTFNGHATQYVDEPIKVKVGVPIRIYLVNAGPNVWSSFHVVGGIFDRVYLGGNPANTFTGLQAMTVGPGDGACFELTLDEPGIYPAVNHAFGHAAHGSIALLEAE
jgi:nitrite reductase (NO-forming)